MVPTSKNTGVTVRLHRTLYSETAIAEAAATFADFAAFAVQPDGDHFAVSVTDIRDDVDGDVVAEFCNFALANSIAAAVSESA